MALLWAHFLWTLPAVHRVRVNDFPAYWAAGKMVLEGHPERIYSPDWKWFTNLPVVAPLFVPLAAMDYATAWEWLWWISVASFAGLFALLLLALARYFPPLDPERAAGMALVFFCFGPVMRRCLSLGQTTPLLVLLFAVVYLLARAGRERSAGALLGFICLVKIPPLLLLPLLALRRRLRMAAVAVLVVAAGVVASYLLFGSELMQQYADRVIWDNLGRVHAAFNNQSLDGAWMRVLSDRGLADWVPVERPGVERLLAWGSVAVVLGALLLFGRSLLLPRARPDDGDARSGSLELEIGLGVCLMLLLFPIVWIHYYLFLALPLCLLPFWWQQRGLEPPRAWWWATVALFVLGTWLASGQEVQENAWYAERETERWLRWRLAAQPLGALLLIGAGLWPLREMARRQARAPG